MKPKTLISSLDFLFKTFTKAEIRGAENVPRSGQAIVVINHLGLLDIVLGYLAINRVDATGWVADKHQKNPLFASIVNSVDGIWLDRENPDLSSMKQALISLKEGRLFAVAPEGTRSRTGAMMAGKEGVAYLAIKSGAPIIPAGVSGTEKVGDDWRHLRKPKLKLQFGQAFRLPKLDPKNRQAQLEAGITEIMCRIAVLIPKKYHGVYAGQARIREIRDGGA